MRLSRWRAAGVLLAGLAFLAALVLFGGAWFYSGEIKSGALVVEHDEPEYDLIVAAAGAGRVTLRTTPETDPEGAWMRDGVWGLKTEDGYDRVGRIVERRDSEIDRELIPSSDPLAAGEPARIDSFAFPEDPQTAHGISFNDVFFSSPLGAFPAWLVDGSLETWVVLVHGRNSNRREGLRMLPTLAELGHPALLITYRNDEGAPASPDGYIRLGETEWQDLEGAVNYAIENGAEGVVLVGYSMGGAVVMSFLYRSSVADRVVGVILDAPLLDFGATVDHGASRRRMPLVGLPIPGILTDLAKYISGFRFDIDWESLDYLRRTDELGAPILLFHGDADPTVPIATSDRLANSRPDIVSYVRVPDTIHVAAWNADPAAYEAAVSGFLRRVAR